MTAGANPRRRRQRRIGGEWRDDANLARRFQGGFARHSGLRFRERQQRSHAIVVQLCLAGAALEARQGLYREIGFAAGQLRLPEFEQQLVLDRRAFLCLQVRSVRRGAVQESRGLAGRVALERVAGRQPQVARRAQVIAGSVEVTGEIGGGLVLAAHEHALHRETSALVRGDALCGRRVIEHDLLVEAVCEAIDRAEHAIGQLDDALAQDERAPAREHLEHRFERELVHVRGLRRQPEGELDADDARGVDGLPFVGGELFELTRHRSDEACRDRGFERVGRQRAAASRLRPRRNVLFAPGARWP